MGAVASHVMSCEGKGSSGREDREASSIVGECSGARAGSSTGVGPSVPVCSALPRAGLYTTREMLTVGVVGSTSRLLTQLRSERHQVTHGL